MVEPPIEQYFFNTFEVPQDTKVDIKHTIDPLREALSRHLGELFADLFWIHKSIKNQQYENALKVVQEFVRKFLMNIYKELYPINHIISDQEMDILMQGLSTLKGFPFNPEELKFYLARTTGLAFNEENNKEAMLKETYELLSTFYHQIKRSIEKTS